MAKCGLERLETMYFFYGRRGSAGVYPGATAIETETLKSPSFSLHSTPNTPICLTVSAHALQPVLRISETWRLSEGRGAVVFM